MVVLDLQMLPMLQLQRIPASTWHRFPACYRTHRHNADSATSQPLVEGFPRGGLDAPHLEAMQLRRPALWKHLDVQVSWAALPPSVEILKIGI